MNTEKMETISNHYEDGLKKCNQCEGFSWNESNLCSSCGGGHSNLGIFENGGTFGFTKNEIVNEILFFITLPAFLVASMKKQQTKQEKYEQSRKENS